MPEQLTATSWTCRRCEVTVSWMEGTERPALPPSWVAEGEEIYCLGCRRDLAGEAALLELAEDAPADQRQQRRSHARIEFEIGRDPSRPDNRIAKSCRTSVIAVRKARQRLGLAARPPRPTDGDN
ncbi:MAG: hypothetical protein M3O25_09315 [Actinomycetota bacterium]|nr:hypothetical protein [Actinomycetota bacterium]